MKPERLLELLANNRELIQQNIMHSEEMHLLLNERYRNFNDVECRLSMELNNSMMELYFHSNYQKTIENSLLAITTYKPVNSPITVWHLWLIGHSYIHLGEPEKAAQYLQDTLERIRTLNINQQSLTFEVYHSLAVNNHLVHGDNSVTFQYLKKAFEAIEYSGDDRRKANCKMGMGNVFAEQKLYEEAIGEYLSAVYIYEKLYDWQNLAATYSNIGYCYIHLKDEDTSEKYLLRALELQTRASSPEHLINTYHHLALLHKQKMNAEHAQDYLNRSKPFVYSSGNKYALKETEMLQAAIDSMN